MLERIHRAGFEEVTDAHFAIFRGEGPDRRRPTEIAQATGLSKQSVNDLLGQLERHGLLVRVPDPADGRARVVRLTARGQELEAVMWAAGRAVEQAWRERIGEPEWGTFRRVLDRLALWDGAERPPEA